MISFILPTINEENNIVSLITQLNRLFPEQCELIIVDDMSTDSTIQNVLELQKDSKNIKLIQRNETGLTSAIKEGIESSRGDILIWMDCDLSHPPTLTPSMVSLIKSDNVDCVIASRYLPSSIDNTYEGSLFVFIHKVLSRILSYTCRLFLVGSLTDFTSGFIAVRKSALAQISYTGGYGEYFMEIMYKLNKQKKRVVEIPYISPKRIDGESKTATNLIELISKGYKYLFKIFEIKLNRKNND